MSTQLDWRIRITETAHKAGFQPDAVSSALICTPAVIENFAREIERQALDRAAQICEQFEREKWMRMATGRGLDVKTAGDCALAIRALIEGASSEKEKRDAS